MGIRGRPLVVTVVGLALLVGGCGGDDEEGTPRPADPGTSSSAPPNAVPVIEVVDPGAEPREALRFAIPQGTKAVATVTTELTIDLEVDGQSVQAPEVPPLLFDMTATADRVQPDGTVDASFTLADFRAGGGATLPEPAQRNLDQLDGIGGTFRMTSRGEATDFSVDIPPGLPELAQSSLESVRDQFASFTVPLPEDPVGVGAKWTARTSTELNGLRTNVEYTYTLRERTADEFVVDVNYTQNAPEQDVDFPGLPAGASARVDGSDISGSGSSQGSLSTFFPTRSTVHGSGTVDMSVEAEGESGRLRQQLDISIELASRPG